MSRKPEREMVVMANKGRQEVEIILLADGLPIGSIKFTQEQAARHARALVEAIEMLAEHKSSKLIIPEKVGSTPMH